MPFWPLCVKEYPEEKPGSWLKKGACSGNVIFFRLRQLMVINSVMSIRFHFYQEWSFVAKLVEHGACYAKTAGLIPETTCK